MSEQWIEKFADELLAFLRRHYGQKSVYPLHEPVFRGKELEYVTETIKSTFVSSVGEYVKRFERAVAAFTGSKYAVATVSGTAALHLALLTAGVGPGDEVITQPLTFVATANAITYTGADIVFLDVDSRTMALSYEQLKEYLHRFGKKTEKNGRKCTIDTATGKVIRAVVPVHVLGSSAQIDAIVDLCREYNISVVEDAAESLGSFYKKRHLGTFGNVGILSFNGNKIITTGNGGMILTNNERIASLAKHLSTQAKLSHPWLYVHDMVGYNYRLSNLQAALGLAQIERIQEILQAKRQVYRLYKKFLCKFDKLDLVEFDGCLESNYWLITVRIQKAAYVEPLLKALYKRGILARRVWTLMNELPMYNAKRSYNIKVAKQLTDTLINLPSSPIFTS